MGQFSRAPNYRNGWKADTSCGIIVWAATGGPMYRKPTPFGPKLEALLDERDHLQIEISLTSESPQPNADKLDALHKRLSQIEDEIARNWGTLRPT